MRIVGVTSLVGQEKALRRPIKNLVVLVQARSAVHPLVDPLSPDHHSDQVDTAFLAPAAVVLAGVSNMRSDNLIFNRYRFKGRVHG